MTDELRRPCGCTWSPERDLVECERHANEPPCDHSELMRLDGDTPCQSCGRRRPLVCVNFGDGGGEFHVCTQCAVVAIRTTGATSAELHFPVGPGDGDAA